MGNHADRYYAVSNYFGGARRFEIPRREKRVRIITVGAKSYLSMEDWSHEDLPDEIDVLCALGLVDIRLPGDIRVEYRGAGFFGAFGGNARHTHPIPGRPVVVRGLVGLGGVEVRVPSVQ
ncbi:MAG: hypothetical protein ACOCYG_09185 [Spirochaetota bacterium]